MSQIKFHIRATEIGPYSNMSLDPSQYGWNPNQYTLGHHLLTLIPPPEPPPSHLYTQLAGLPASPSPYLISSWSWRMGKRCQGCFLLWQQVLNRGANTRRCHPRQKIVVAAVEVEDPQPRSPLRGWVWSTSILLQCRKLWQNRLI
jgi:hypothetical protein